MPKVSIVTPCYNSSEFLETTFKSVTSQSFTDWEWLLVDDCSSDGTYKLLQTLQEKDSRIKIYKNEINSGASFTRNVGLENSSGEYIAFLDSDDLWNKDKLEKQVNFMDSKNCDFSYHNFNMIDFDGAFLKYVASPFSVNLSLLQKFNPIFTSSVMIKKKAIGDTRFKLELRRRQDYIFWYQVMNKTGKALNVGEILGLYRTGNQSSLSHNKFRVIPIQWNIYRNEFNLNPIKSFISLTAYAFHGIKKYFT